MKPSFSIAFQTDKPVSAYGALAEKAEEYGFDGVSVYNDLFYQPAWLPLLEIARHTRRVRIGPAAVNPFTCHPINIAGNIALVDEVSNGRAYLGLARGSWLDYLGIEPAHPVTALSEAFQCIRLLLRRSTEPFDGTVFRLRGGDSLRWSISRSDLPFLLGAWGDQTIRACIPFVDEIKLGGTSNPAAVRRVRSLVDRVANEAGRDRECISIVVGAVSVVDEDGEAARASVRRQAALYLPVIAPLDPSLEIEPEALEQIKAAAAAFDFERGARYIPDDILRRVAFAGTPAQVAEQTRNVIDAGAARVEFGAPHGRSEDEGMRLLGKQVLPALRG